MTGVLSYIAIVALVSMWMIGWLGLTLLLGAFFDLPPKVSAISGVVLGPLGFVMIIFVGIAHRKSGGSSAHSTPHQGVRGIKQNVSWDPFA